MSVFSFRSLRLPTTLRALRHRNYRLLFFAQLISVVRVWMQSTAQGWLVLRLSDSSFWLGVVAAAQSLPVMLFSLPAGALADRLPKRRLLLVTQSIAMLCALTLALLTLTGRVQIWHVPLAMIMICAVGWCGITSLTLSNTLLQMIVPNALRGRVMVVYSLMIMGVSQLAGLLLGGIADLTGDVALTVRLWRHSAGACSLRSFCAMAEYYEMNNARLLQASLPPKHASIVGSALHT